MPVYAAIGCAAGSVNKRLERAGSQEAKAVAEIERLILDGVQQTRALARGLFPVQNDAWGLPSALTELAASTTRLLDFRCTFTANVTSVAVGNDRSTHLYRIAQEAVSNAARHSNASTASIRLEVDSGGLTLSIEDDGTGFAETSPNIQGLGLTIMQYRARQMGGRINFSKNSCGGAVVACHLPHS